MFREPFIDPTAGERARRIRLHPERPQPILDPTDPRYGTDPSTGEAAASATLRQSAEKPRSRQR